eukprot:scaffold249398_cov38-Prasinocladus_malaysianus.AAC.1
MIHMCLVPIACQTDCDVESKPTFSRLAGKTPWGTMACCNCSTPTHISRITSSYYPCEGIECECMDLRQGNYGACHVPNR